jgi:orotate phosphoribosyltransferase-like protein
MKVASIQKEAVKLYKSGMSMEAVALELGVAYRTARKAIYSKGVEARDPSARLVGRTSPTGQKAVTSKKKKKAVTPKKKRK